MGGLSPVQNNCLHCMFTPSPVQHHNPFTPPNTLRLDSERHTLLAAGKWIPHISVQLGSLSFELIPSFLTHFRVVRDKISMRLTMFVLP